VSAHVATLYFRSCLHVRSCLDGCLSARAGVSYGNGHVCDIADVTASSHVLDACSREVTSNDHCEVNSWNHLLSDTKLNHFGHDVWRDVLRVACGVWRGGLHV
jgi:hypothetical protein